MRATMERCIAGMQRDRADDVVVKVEFLQQHRARYPMPQFMRQLRLSDFIRALLHVNQRLIDVVQDQDGHQDVVVDHLAQSTAARFARFSHFGYRR
ncbi:hypothetical protein [Rhodopila sp.]|uniref:hypothetical protein n=1 Tax=Rhodopila sp. TaxID=2480087 RepID=UPI003D0D16BC